MLDDAKHPKREKPSTATGLGAMLEVAAAAVLSVAEPPAGPVVGLTMVDPPVTTVEPPVTKVEPPETKVELPETMVEPPETTVEPPVTKVEPPLTKVEPPVGAVVEPTGVVVPLPERVVVRLEEAVDPGLAVEVVETAPGVVVAELVAAVEAGRLVVLPLAVQEEPRREC